MWEFTQQQGPSNAMSMCSAPIDFFQLFIDDNLLTLIETETNRYGWHKDSSFVDTNKEELKKFIALCIQMGLVKMPRLRDYWSTRPALGGHPFAGKIVPRNRLKQLLRSLHLCDISAPDGDRLYKIKAFVDIFDGNCERNFQPGKGVTIDKLLVPFRERIVFRQ
ncbi:hypothetical protein V3C99_005202 [Haemonchus contortus]